MKEFNSSEMRVFRGGVVGLRIFCRSGENGLFFSDRQPSLSQTVSKKKYFL